MKNVKDIVGLNNVEKLRIYDTFIVDLMFGQTELNKVDTVCRIIFIELYSKQCIVPYCVPDAGSK